MALLGIILTAALVAFVVYLIWYLFFNKAQLLSKCQSGTKKLVISPKKLSGNSHTNNYAYSIWFYVTDWSYRLTESKDLLIRGGAAGTANPRITLAPYENNLSITINTFPTGNKNNSVLGSSVAGPAPSQSPTCSVNNFPLQRWVNLIVSLNNRTLDVYLDGKLVRTCVLPAPAKIDPDAPVVVTPGGGFKGWTSNTQYFDTPLNPQEAFNIYAAGPKCGSMTLFDKYQLKIAYLVNNKEEAEITI